MIQHSALTSFGPLKTRAIAVHKNIKKLNVAKDWRAAAFWLERNVPEFARKQINKNLSDEPGTNNGDASVDTLIIDPERMRKLSEAHDGFMRKLEAKAKEGESGSS
jgi:hypothetical protein